MKKRLLLAPGIALFMLSVSILPLVLAQQAENELNALNYNIELEIIKSNMFVTHSITFAKSVEGIFVVELPKDAKNIESYADGDKIETVVLNDKSKEAKLVLSNAREVKITFITAEFLEISKKSYFLADLKIPISADKLKVRLILPEYNILDKAGTDSVFPEPTSLSSDGQRIVIDWLRNSVKENEGILAFVIFKEKTSASTIITLAAIIIIAIVLSLFLMRWKKEKKPSYLIESEKAVINALQSEKGEMWQKQIQLKTGFSKAKLSRVIRDLEVRGLIKRIPLGNTNKIKLQKVL